MREYSARDTEGSVAYRTIGSELSAISPDLRRLKTESRARRGEPCALRRSRVSYGWRLPAAQALAEFSSADL